VSRASDLFEQIAPELETRERAVREAEPTLPEPEVLDRALRQALSRLRHDVSRGMLDYLRWRADEARRAARAAREASAAAREARLALGRAPRRAFRDRDGLTWVAHELTVGPVAWAPAPGCLIFHSESAVRRVWHYPADWHALPDAELEALSWSA
jgi:hypothetical protein